MQDTDPWFAKWRSGWRPDRSEERWRSGWYAHVAQTVARGVDVRRLRVVSEPVTDYIRYEHDLTFANVESGESVRWLPRTSAFDLLMPALDGWVVDGTLILHYWDGEGRPVSGRGEIQAGVSAEICSDPEVGNLYSAAFDRLWERAIPHEDYVLR
ncbi:hypothetical protein LZ495_43380 [Yinghuangia sp. KLBMP8922]|uniref:DUF6879 domain-containing protein n=2 Tax=Yinghuangia soli TaxID=2908204 RepID=A0AA41Q9G6_9ACTN|nr:DUF6879 family protein [Yinghuangia soli]MCF2534033.1 hypothetical protein [Yinghuangia soli]